jgi:hypothetical protein
VGDVLVSALVRLADPAADRARHAGNIGSDQGRQSKGDRPSCYTGPVTGSRAREGIVS